MISQDRFYCTSNDYSWIGRCLTLGSDSAVEGVARDQYALPATLPLCLQDIDGLDRVAIAALAVRSLHGVSCIDHHVGEEIGVPGHMIKDNGSEFTTPTPSQRTVCTANIV